MIRRSRPMAHTLVCLLLIALASQLGAIVEPRDSAVGEKAFRHPDLEVAQSIQQPGELPQKAAAEAAAKLASLGMPADRGRLDTRTGRWATLLASEPLLPGKGLGNELSWELLKTEAPRSEAGLERAAMNAFVGYLANHKQALGIEPVEIAAAHKVTVHRDGTMVQIYGPRVYKGVRVRDSYVSGSISHGNLILFSAHNWGDISLSVEPKVFYEDAFAALQSHLGSHSITGSWGKAELNIVPVARSFQLKTLAVGTGLGHRLAWVLRPSFEGDMGSWEAMVDAHTGEVLSFADTNHYAEVKGGVLPVTNDGIVPDGVEQAGWPMPFADVGAETTDTGGNFTNTGTVTTDFFGPYVNINDQCGTSSLTGSGVLDWGTSAGTDCATPGFGGAGNTHASRTGFYELNKVIEMARGQLPSNSWLQSRLISNMNINNTCNAFWNGTVNFYRSGGGCFNTGEIAGVFDHEWGHGMDANDATPGIAGPSGEGIADIYTALRLDTSCIGRNFRSTNCTGFGDPCLNCTGVRDIDYLQRASGQPHDYSWSNANCGGSVHCVGAVYAEAVWSLWKRKLQSAPYNYDDNTAHEIVTRLTFIGAGNTGTWFSGGPPNGGCAGSSGYMNYLAADDDNGNLNDGTPHMQAIFDAFDDQEIACGTPMVQESGCANNPASAPVVTATPLDKSVSLSWGAVANASSYEVFRTEGVFACDFGKVRLGETTGTSWNDSGLQNGRDYSYVVIPKGAADSCFGPGSACSTVAPAAGPNLDVDPSSAVLAINSGDGDPFVDNCETGTMTFDVNNTGLGSLTNVRITGVTAVSHPATTIDTTFPAAVSPSTLAQGATGTGSFDFTAGGLAFGDTLVFEVTVTADELSPTTKTQSLTIVDAESDLNAVASRTYDFETGDEGWTLIQGTFFRASTGGGAGGSSWYERTSSNLDNQCDQIRSPALRLTSTSTIEVFTNFDIENESSPGTWWDRANVAFFENGSRNSVDPDSGRLYNATGSGATCVTAGQSGWAASQPTWASSGFSAAALNSAGRAGQTLQIDVAYGTDVSVVGDGFRFDRLTVTDFEELVPDGQSDTCGPPPCGDAFCDPATEDQCSCPADCGTPPGSETPNVDCNDGTDNDCDGNADCADADCATDPACAVTCDNDGTCESGEDCNNCPNDCISGTSSGAVCGNGLCETADGEDCVTCAADCNGKQNGKPSGRFCCGNGGSNPVGCSDSRCTTDGFSCTTDPAPSGNYCCGDASCDDPEDSFNCEIDCGPPPCGDGFCDPATEDQCSCAVDCGTPPANEVGMCDDGADNDCDGAVDCSDTVDCGSDPVCQCLPKNASCSLDSECCSGDCKNNGRCR